MAYTLSSFTEKASKIHNNYYNYSKTTFVRSNIKIEIICPKHRSFMQSPSEHLKGKGCKKCNIERQRLSTEEFISKASKIHNNYYDYSKANYITGGNKAYEYWSK